MNTNWSPTILVLPAAEAMIAGDGMSGDKSDDDKEMSVEADIDIIWLKYYWNQVVLLWTKPAIN